MTPYEAGYDAARKGLNITANPYTEGTEAYHGWNNGWSNYWLGGEK